jgi:hypothetical protein
MNKDHRALMENQASLLENHVALLEEHRELLKQHVTLQEEHLTLQEEHIALLRERHAHWEELGYVVEDDQEHEPSQASVIHAERSASHLRIVGDGA